MKKLLILTLCLPLSLLTLAAPRSAVKHNPKTRGQSTTLKNAVATWQQKYHVKIAYNASLEDVAVVVVSTREFANVEAELAYSLSKNQLAYKKIKDDFFIITSKQSKSKLPPDAGLLEANEAGGITSLPRLRLALAAADRTVSGRVTDEKGDPIPGVTIVVRGTSRGGATDATGHYQLTVPEGATLVFSAVGLLRQEVSVGTRTTIDVTLRNDTQKLNEVVVIGYGQQSSKTVSTAITQVSGENIALQPVGTPGEALAAQAPGVEVQSDRGGTPGAPPSIRIRGGGSLGTNSDPLYVVDGYPLQDPSQFNLINPTDIESISILKDAASAAIYGSRAANGVVIVTTKRGKAGKTVFSISAYTGWQQISKQLKVLNRDEYIKYVQFHATARAYPAAPAATPFTNLDPSTLSDTDWQDEIYRVAKISNYQLSASGGSDRARFSVSGGYFQQDGILKGTDYERFNVRFNLDANLVPKLKIGVSVAPAYAVQDRQAAAGQFNGSNGSENNGTRGLPPVTQVAIVMPPTIPVFRPNGDYGQGYNGAERNPNGTAFYQANLFNPVAVLDLNQNQLKNYRLFGNSYLEWEPLEGLLLKTSGGLTLNVDEQHAYIPGTLATEVAPQANLSTPVLSSIFGRESQFVSVDYLWENTATYAKTLGNHSFTVLGLYSLQKFQARSTATSGRAGTFANALLDNPLASPDRVGELDYDQNAFLSYAGRVTYDYKKKYIASAALRSDASSRFGPNNRFATFPSASLAWRVSEEPFWQGLKSKVSELKLRASYGETGNANIGSFNYLNNIVGRNYSYGGVRTFGYVQNGFANPSLTWEKNKQTDLGLETGFLDDKFVLTLDYYSRITTGMLLQRDLPGIVGYANNFRTNAGKLQNRGLELGAVANLKVGAVKWTINGNISGNRSKVLDLGGPTAFPAEPANFGWNNVYQVKVGEPLGNMYGFKVLGIFKNAEDLANYPKNIAGDKIGNWIIQDTNGDGVVNESDRTKLGKGVPDFVYGLTQNLQYKNFDLSLILQGVQGIDVIQGNLRQFWGNAQFNTIRDVAFNMFDPTNPHEAKYPQPGAGGITPGNQLTDRTMFNASYLRVRNLTLGYTIQAALLQRAKLQSVRLYVTGQNLLTFTSYPGTNPETSINAGTFNNGTNSSLIRPGLDQGAYPASRTYTVGVNIGF
ncbi:TonB-dependent receptor [Hymenobacter sp. GOD-10R]|uniref:SusC/RagA family TonB-linked outer membrane protein n=1 Tax=Hymenobacter sp. GOD-10R TaxID=3093922 RepID=UPI002D76FC17|nr:TonB-dependent receptor [Hymenobacter sp. GOD-10R]WRQ31106.1 TonB-dependent receptor [Hymenobacter sp. GOD-10R]